MAPAGGCPAGTINHPNVGRWAGQAGASHIG